MKTKQPHKPNGDFASPLSDWQRAEIVRLYRRGVRSGIIADLVGCDKCTVSRIYKKQKTNGRERA